MDLSVILDGIFDQELKFYNLEFSDCNLDLNEPFEFIRNLGRGATGEVNLVEQNGCLYAEKSTRLNVNSELEMLKLVNEVCPDGTVKYYGFKVDQGITKIYTEYLNGPTLLEYVSENDVDDLLKIMIKLLEIITCLHNNDIIHGDIKLQNVIMIDDNPILIDFGFSCIDFSKNKNTKCRAKGTPYYIAPELWEIKENTSSRKYKRYNTVESAKPIDMWSLGILFYYLIYKKYPYSSKYTKELSKEVRSKVFTIEYSDYSIQEAIKWMLIKNPSYRGTSNDILNYLYDTIR